MDKLKHILAGFVIMGLFIGLFLILYNGFQDSYEFTSTDTDSEGRTVMGALGNLTLISGATDLSNAIHNIIAPNTPLDFVGGLLFAGIGAVKSIAGVITFPTDLLLVLTNFYTGLIPPVLSQTITVIFSIYIAFILLRYYTRTE